MEDHKSYTDGFCRLCDSKLLGHNQYKVLSWSQEINHAYRSDNIDISRDDPICQSSLICRVCYRNLQKVKEEMKHKKKNPTSSKHFRYQMPPYRENVKVHLVKDCLCQQEGAEPAPDPAAEPAAEPGGVEGHGNPDHLMGVTPSKVRRLMELPEVSPSDKPTAREARKKHREGRTLNVNILREKSLKLARSIWRKLLLGKFLHLRILSLLTGSVIWR